MPFLNILLYVCCYFTHLSTQKSACSQYTVTGNRITVGEGLTERYETNKMHLSHVTIVFCFNRPNTRDNYKFTEERGCPNTLKNVLQYEDLRTANTSVCNIPYLQNRRRNIYDNCFFFCILNYVI
jgi:hypothetical protein